jgi:hypothetical protein
MQLVLQPEGSSLCGQACVAMAAGVSLEAATKAVGHGKERGTYTREIIAALRALNISCADRCRRIGRVKSFLPPRGLIVISRPKKEGRRRRSLFHWMLVWDGVVYDPGGCWPGGYVDWRITSYLEIYR